MKRFLFICALLILSSSIYGQSKKELQEKVNTINEEKSILQNEKIKLSEQILELKQQLLDLKTENSECKTENDKLLKEIASKSAEPTSGTPQGIISSQNTSSQATTRCKAITAKGTQCARNAEPGSDYCWQHRSTYEPTSTSKSSFSSSPNANTSTSSGRTIYTGPRGGKYYINSKGNKVYIKK